MMLTAVVWEHQTLSPNECDKVVHCLVQRWVFMEKLWIALQNRRQNLIYLVTLVDHTFSNNQVFSAIRNGRWRKNVRYFRVSPGLPLVQRPLGRIILCNTNGCSRK